MQVWNGMSSLNSERNYPSNQPQDASLAHAKNLSKHLINCIATSWQAQVNTIFNFHQKIQSTRLFIYIAYYCSAKYNILQ